MRAGLVEAIVRGDRATWAAIGGLWLVTAVLVFLRRRDGGPRYGRTLLLLTLTTATAVMGIALASALAIPRVTWRSASNPALLKPTGETWRLLRGPATSVVVDDAPDVAIPTLDSEGRWVLYGLISGAPVLAPPAPQVPPEAGGARICPAPGSDTLEPCRAWPSTWPNPGGASTSDELTWRSDGARSALAYDIESDRFLYATRDAEERGAIELLGRIANDAPAGGPTALFILQRIAHGRFQAVRVVALPTEGGTEFRLQRADVSLTGSAMFLHYAAAPLLFVVSFALPFAWLAYLFAPALLARRLRKATTHEADPALRVLPASARALSGRTDATVASDSTIGKRLLPRGSVVELLASDGEPLESRAWFELPPKSKESAAIALVPADTEPFRRSARAWIQGITEPAAVFVAGLAAVLPAVVALFAAIASR